MTAGPLPIESMWGEDWEQHTRVLSRLVHAGGRKTLLEGNIAIIRRKDATRASTNRIYRDVSAVQTRADGDDSDALRLGYAVMAGDESVAAVVHVDVFGLLEGKGVIAMVDDIVQSLFRPPLDRAPVLDCSGHMAHFPAVLARLFRKVGLKRGTHGLPALRRGRVETALGKMPLEKRAMLVFGTGASLVPSEQPIWSPTRSRKIHQLVREGISEEVRLMELMRDLPHFGVWKLPSSRRTSAPVAIISTGAEVPAAMNVETLAIRRRRDCLVALLGRDQHNAVCLFALTLVGDELVADTAALADLVRRVAASAMSETGSPILVPASQVFRATMAADNPVNAFFPGDDEFPEREAGGPELAATRKALREAKGAAAFNERMLQQLRRNTPSPNEHLSAARNVLDTQAKAEELLQDRGLVIELQDRLDSLTSSRDSEIPSVRTWLLRGHLSRLGNVKDPLASMFEERVAT